MLVRTRKLTMLRVYQGCGKNQETVFLWVDYLDDKLDFYSVRKEVNRALGPSWMWYQGWPEDDYVNGAAA